MKILAHRTLREQSGFIQRLRRGISRFHPNASRNTGRTNLTDFVTFKVIADFGHDTAAFKAMRRLLPNMTKGQIDPFVLDEFRRGTS